MKATSKRKCLMCLTSPDYFDPWWYSKGMAAGSAENSCLKPKSGSREHTENGMSLETNLFQQCHSSFFLSQTVPPTGNHVYKQMSLWGHSHSNHWSNKSILTWERAWVETYNYKGIPVKTPVWFQIPHLMNITSRL